MMESTPSAVHAVMPTIASASKSSAGGGMLKRGLLLTVLSVVLV